jgi:hypothetical protein
LNALASAPRLPRAQNPTITLLQKARGQYFTCRCPSLSLHARLEGNKVNEGSSELTSRKL